MSFSQDQATAGINYVNFNPLEVFPVNKFSGINTDDDPLTLVDQSPDSLNVETDSGPGLTGRKGFVSLSTEPLKAMWVLPHSSGTRYKIGQSSGTLKASLDGINYNITVSTVDQQYTTAGAVVGDTFYFSDLTNGLKSATFSGSVPTVVSVSTSLKFSMLIAAQGRLMGAGIPGSERILRISEYTPNESNFTLVANSSDTMPAAITIPGALDEPISGLYSSFRGYPVVFKPHSFGILYGTRRSNFGYQKYSDQVGTAYPESVQDCDGLLRWLGPSRTVWEFNGVGWKDISNDPKNRKRISSFLATVDQGDASQRSYQFTTQGDFAQGTSLGISTETTPGSVVISTSNNNITNNSFESGTLFASSWTTSGSDWWNDFSQDGTSSVRIGPTSGSDTFVKILDSSGNELSTVGTITSSSYSTTAWNPYTVSVSPYAGMLIKLKFTVDLNSFYSDTFLCSGSDITFYLRLRLTAGRAGFYVDNVLNGMMIRTSTGSWVSPNVQTTGMSAHGIFSTGETLNSGIITYGVYTDTDSTHFVDANNVPISTSYISSATVSNGNVPSLSTASYVFGSAYFSISASTQNPTLNDMTFSWQTGSTLRVASAFPNKRYWLSVAVSSTANNRVLVYDKNEDWQLYSGINADAMIFDSNLYFSNPSGVFQGETGYNDNGASITSYYRTPTLALGGLDNYVKFHSLRLTTAESASTLSTTYQFNGDGTDYSFGDYAMNQATGYQNFKLPFPASEVSQGKFLNLKFSVTGTAYWRILNASIYHRKDLLPR